MYICKMKTMLIIILILSLGGCSSDKNNKSHAHKKEQHKEHVNDHMNKSSFEELVAAFDDPERDQWQKPNDVINFLGEIDQVKILDIGCGTGYFAFRLAEVGAHVICADIDDRFLNHVNKKKLDQGFTDEEVTTKIVHEDSPGEYDMTFGKVIIVDTYHHIDNRVEYFKKVKDILSEGGMLYVIDFRKDAEMDFGPPPEHRLSSEKVIEELKDAGFTNELVDVSTLPYQYIVRMNVQK
jgi:2-polyprenyl-3-methyl-5-hydroxy-6-metoxy-1,4-benzoquinol methylase